MLNLWKKGETLRNLTLATDLRLLRDLKEQVTVLQKDISQQDWNGDVLDFSEMSMGFNRILNGILMG